MLRYFNPARASERFGEDREHETHLIPLALASAAGEQSHLTIRGTDYPTPDGTCIRDYIDVRDLADANLRALEALDGEQVLAVTLGTGQGVSVREVVASAERVTGRAVQVVEGARRPDGGDVAIMFADPSRSHHLPGWSAARGLDDMIESAWSWRRGRPRGYAGISQHRAVPVRPRRLIHRHHPPAE